jgi:hypothetical protein
MDELRDFLHTVESRGVARGNFLGLLHVLIGRRIRRADGRPVSNGLTWREVAALLKRARWDRGAVTEVGLNPSELPPRDRERFWYAAIVRSGVDAAAAVSAGDRLAALLRPFGFEIGAAPGQPDANK